MKELIEKLNTGYVELERRDPEYGMACYKSVDTVKTDAVMLEAGEKLKAMRVEIDELSKKRAQLSDFEIMNGFPDEHLTEDYGCGFYCVARFAEKMHKIGVSDV